MTERQCEESIRQTASRGHKFACGSKRGAVFSLLNTRASASSSKVLHRIITDVRGGINFAALKLVRAADEFIPERLQATGGASANFFAICSRRRTLKWKSFACLPLHFRRFIYGPFNHRLVLQAPRLQSCCIFYQRNWYNSLGSTKLISRKC